jgi:hypothetical protein
MDRAPASSRAVVGSHDKASSPSTEDRATDVVHATKPESPTMPAPTTVVSPPVLTPPAVTKSPAKNPDSSGTVRVQKGKGKKKTAKKAEKSGHKWKTNAAGYPAMAGTWSGADGRSITVVQQRDQFTATGVGTDSDHTGVLWRWSGTVDQDGHLNGRLVYTQTTSDSVDRDASATLSPDGKAIQRSSEQKAGVPDLPWKKLKPTAKKK